MAVRHAVAFLPRWVNIQRKANGQVDVSDVHSAQFGGFGLGISAGTRRAAVFAKPHLEHLSVEEPIGGSQNPSPPVARCIFARLRRRS